MMFPKDIFFNGSNKKKTRSLFYELEPEQKEDCIFTLKDEDIVVEGKKLISLKRLYLNFVANDPTEYEFAQEVFGSWEIWEAITVQRSFKAIIEKWRSEVAIKIKSEAIRSIAEEMRSGGRSSFSAAKLLLDKGWIEKETFDAKTKKKLKEKEEQENKEAMSLLLSDAERLGLRLN